MPRAPQSAARAAVGSPDAAAAISSAGVAAASSSPSQPLASSNTAESSTSSTAAAVSSVRPSRSSRVVSSPLSHEVRVSCARSARFFVAISLRLLVDHAEISVVGLGASIQLAIEVAQTVVALGFAEPCKIATSSVAAGGHGADRTPKPQFRMDLKRLRIPEDHTPWTKREQALADVAERERAPLTASEHLDE